MFSSSRICVNNSFNDDADILVHGKNKPYTAVTVQVNRLTSEAYRTDDMSGIVDLIDVIRLQNDGPREAARAIRKKLKYGSVEQQLRALTILDGLMENAGPRFQRTFADEALLERLRVCATDSVSDARVKKRCQNFYQHWAGTYQGVAGMEGIVALQRQLPKRKAQPTQQQSRVLRETQPVHGEDPFGTAEDEDHDADDAQPESSHSTPDAPIKASVSREKSSSTFGSFSGFSTTRSKTAKRSKDSKRKNFSLEREKPRILEIIASSSIASTDLLNALKLVDREHKRVSEDPHTTRHFDKCKRLRRQVLHYIQAIESEEWLGSLISANDALVEALMAFEILDKSVDDDSDSDAQDFGDDESSTPPPKPARPKAGPDDLSGLKHMKVSETSQSRGQTAIHEDEDEEDDEDPFADRNAL